MTLGFQSKLGNSMYAKMSRGQLESSLKLVESGPDTVMLTIQGTAHVYLFVPLTCRDYA